MDLFPICVVSLSHYVIEATETLMKLSGSLSFLLFISLGAQLWAHPGVAENIDYKVTLSETLPGIDAQGTLPTDAAITVTVLDKLHSVQTYYPLKVYSINSYFLLNDTLNLIARTTLQGSQTAPHYNFLQLNLSNPGDSRQFTNLRQFSFSPDNQTLFAVRDASDSTLADWPQAQFIPPKIGLIRLGDAPVQWDWIYAEPVGINLFKGSFQAPVTALTIYDPVGWSADSLSAVFLFSVDDGTRDTHGQPLLKDYLADLDLSDKGLTAAAQPVDLSPYGFHQGAAITDLQCAGGKASLFLTQENSTHPAQVDFKLSPR